MKKFYFSLLILGMVSCGPDYVMYDEPLVDTNNPEEPINPGDDDAPVVTGNCLPEAFEANLIASYNFANGSILDGSGNNNHLSFVDGTVPNAVDRNGNSNCALEFNATSYLKMNQIQALQQVDKFSISLWFKTNVAFDGSSSPTNLTDRPRYFILGETATPYNNPNQGLRKSFFVGQFDCLRVFSSNGASELWESTDSFPTDPSCGGPRVDVWNHVVINYDSTNSVYELFVNGVLTTEANPTYNQYFNELNEVFIGKGMFGTLDDIFIFNKVLSVAEVNQMKNLQPCCN